MRQIWQPTLVIVGALVAALFAPVMHGDDLVLQSFYVQRSHFSDVISSYTNYTDILDVTHRQPGGIRVRWIRMSSSMNVCECQLLEAEERVVPDLDITTLAGHALCDLDQQRVDAAVAGLARDVGAYEGFFNTVVTTCGGRETPLAFPMEWGLDWEAVHKRDFAVAAAADLAARVKDDVFGSDFRFWSDDAERGRQQEQIGRALMPDIVAGRYRATLKPAYTNQLPQLVGRRHSKLQPAELLERDKLDFYSYRPVETPEDFGVVETGDVHVRLTVDRGNGRVTGATALSGNSNLFAVALEGVRHWWFTPSSLTSDSVDVTLRFQKRCD